MPAPAASSDHASTWTLFVLVFGAIAFNLALCFANTNIAGVSNLHVIASEVLIISGVMLVSYRSIDQVHLIAMGAVAFLALSLASIRVVTGADSGIDIKIVRDLVIPFAFFILGARVKDLRTADTIVKASVAIVVVVALFEYFFIDLFTRFFSIAKYYIARGTMEARQALQSSDLFVSGIRPAGAEGGRNLFPFLGDHRVSSVFLEPVSLGNFGVIVFMWGLVRSKFEGRLYLGVMAAALLLIVLADSRFGAYLCAIVLLVSFVPTVWAMTGAMALPLVALATLSLVPALVTGSYDPQNRYVDNGFVGRFVLSAQILGEFDVLSWLALKTPRMQAFDSGYAYIISGVGVIGLAMLWMLLFSIRSPDRQFNTYRNLAAVYFATILCVSNSPFTIKTASLLWFLLGVLAHRPVSSRSHIAPSVAIPGSVSSGTLVTGLSRQPCWPR